MNPKITEIMEYKRLCKHTDVVHWKDCPECREYMVRQDFQSFEKAVREETIKEYCPECLDLCEKNGNCSFHNL